MGYGVSTTIATGPQLKFTQRPFARYCTFKYMFASLWFIQRKCVRPAFTVM